MKEFNEKQKTTKNIPFNKTHVLVEKETFDSMNNVIKETKKVVEIELKIKPLFNEIDSFTKGHQTLQEKVKNLKNIVIYVIIILGVGTNE